MKLSDVLRNYYRYFWIARDYALQGIVFISNFDVKQGLLYLIKPKSVDLARAGTSPGPPQGIYIGGGGGP